MSQSIAFSSLKQLTLSSITELRSQLQSHGYARIRIDDTQLNEALSEAINDAQQLNGFRFPPLDEAAVYTPVRRRAFSGLYTIAVEVFRALVHGLECPSSIREALSRIDPTTQVLFGADGHGHQPFSHGQPFSQSFFNLFNYDGGALNPHVDRSLLTVIRVRPGQNEGKNQSTLWVEGTDGVWRNADQEVDIEDVLILIGEDCEAIRSIQDLNLRAASHSVRVDPCGGYIPHSHFRPDPQTPTNHNRKSAAFILRHEPGEISADSDTRMA